MVFHTKTLTFQLKKCEICRYSYRYFNNFLMFYNFALLVE